MRISLRQRRLWKTKPNMRWGRDCSLLRRLSSLAYFHHGWELDLDFNGLIERAAKVRLVEDNTRWVDWERYSSRQDNKMNLGGMVGRVVYEGELGEFMMLLRLGELVHVGKGAVFGMGIYRMPAFKLTSDGLDPRFLIIREHYIA